MELKKAGDRTYYIEHSTNIGVYKTGENTVCLIDTGMQGDGEKIDEIISARGWKIEYIINTHTHIDHLGGNEYLMKKYKIPAYCTFYDMSFAHFSDLESAYMNGGHPTRKLKKVFSHPGMIGFDAIERNSFPGISWMYLPGHTFSMMGIKTSDDVWFLADAYLSREYLKNYRYGYLYDVAGYIETLDKIKRLDGCLFVPSHGVPETNVRELADMNRNNILEIIEIIEEICGDYVSFDIILQKLYQRFGMRATMTQHVMISSTTKCYLTYLQDMGRLDCGFKDNIMVWKYNGKF